MKALTLWQPWATLIAIGAKTYETRSWGTSYRGLVAIHAGKAWNAEQDALKQDELFRLTLLHFGYVFPRKGPLLRRLQLPLGAIVAVATLKNCIFITDWWNRNISTQEEAFGDFSLDRYAWELVEVKALKEPIPCKGGQGLWNVPPNVEAQIRRQVGLDN